MAIVGTSVGQRNAHILGRHRDSINVDPEHVKRVCGEYLGQRTGTYEYRCRRYAAVHNKLTELGLWNWRHQITDIGAGDCQFDHFLRASRDWQGIYHPIDGAVDGTNIDLWVPQTHAHYFTCIEVLEHLHDPDRVLRLMDNFSTRGAVATTPNPETVDVLGMDETHIHELPERWFHERGWETQTIQLFDTPEDTILAWKGKL